MRNYHHIWTTPPENVSLTENVVQVWQARLDLPLAAVQQYQQALSPAEISRAVRFYFDRDRQRWIVARGLLRMLLGHYTQTDPRLIVLQNNAYGKPALAFPPQNPLLQFNLSHSADLALFAFAQQRQLGIDVEYMRTTIEYDELARHAFSAFEQAVLRGLPPAEKRQAFYQCWTRKEAYIKARGLGLSLPLDLFDVSLLPGEPAMLLASREQPQEIQRWSMRDLVPHDDYAAALTVEGAGWQLHCWHWVDSARPLFNKTVADTNEI